MGIRCLAVSDQVRVPKSVDDTTKVFRVTRDSLGGWEDAGFPGVLLTGPVSVDGLQKRLHMMGCWAHCGVCNACRNLAGWQVSVDKRVLH